MPRQPWTLKDVAVGVSVEKKADGRHRVCRNCGVQKPDRTHHDSQTKACVARHLATPPALTREAV